MDKDYINGKFAVTHNSEVKFKGNYNSCYTWLLNNQPFSTAYATRYEGWDVIQI